MRSSSNGALTLTVILPWLFWPHPSSWRSAELPGDGVMNHSPPVCVRASQLVPENVKLFLQRKLKASNLFRQRGTHPVKVNSRLP